MMRQLHGVRALSSDIAGVMFLASANSSQRTDVSLTKRGVSAPVGKFPERPDASVVNESIPLFYIGRNRNGAWVVRGADGQSGGQFVLKQSAVRFARRQSLPAGCAMMFVAEPFEPDANVGPATANELAACRTELIVGVFHVVVAAWRKFAAYVSRTIAAQRRNRAAIEQELFGGLYTLSSKNDDDLPIP